MVNDISKHISLILRLLRKERGWSLDKTAQETGVSKAMLGQIEREESSPTIATLWKIASGFQTSFSSFLEAMDVEIEHPIYRSGLRQLSADNEKMRVIPLFPFDHLVSCEIFSIELLPTCVHLSLPHKQGVIEHVMVVDGALEVLINGAWKKLYKGEGVRFNANQSHGYRNLTSISTTFHNIIHYPAP